MFAWLPQLLHLFFIWPFCWLALKFYPFFLEELLAIINEMKYICWILCQASHMIIAILWFFSLPHLIEIRQAIVKMTMVLSIVVLWQITQSLQTLSQARFYDIVFCWNWSGKSCALSVPTTPFSLYVMPANLALFEFV